MTLQVGFNLSSTRDTISSMVHWFCPALRYFRHISDHVFNSPCAWHSILRESNTVRKLAVRPPRFLGFCLTPLTGTFLLRLPRQLVHVAHNSWHVNEREARPSMPIA